MNRKQDKFPIIFSIFVTIFCLLPICSTLFSKNRFIQKKNSEFDIHYASPDILKKGYKVRLIALDGLSLVPERAVLSRIFLRIGETFDAQKVKKTIRNIYDLGYFSDVFIEYIVHDVSDEIDVFICVVEKKKVSEVVIVGNENVSRDTLNKKLQFEKITWIDEKELQGIIKNIKKIYAEKQYHKVVVTGKIEIFDDKSSKVIIAINEGVYSRIRSINFKGNKSMSRHILKDSLATKEAWVLGFFDNSGVFRKEMLDYDRYQIENVYQNNGYHDGHVISIDVQEEVPGLLDITYEVYEGECYFFRDIILPENSSINEFTLRQLINIRSGSLYSREKIREAIKKIKNKLGEIGYMYAEVHPKMKIDRKKRMIDLEFFVEKGKLVYVREINITGNMVTIDNVIRRELSVVEGSLLTTKTLSDSKRALETLGYFVPRDGVTWIIRSYNRNQAIIDLLIKEAKTGKFFLNIGINSGNTAGSDLGDAAPEIHWYDSFLNVSKIGVTIKKSNFLGRGLGYFLDGSYSSLDKSLSCGAFTNWLFDWPISLAWNLSFRTLKYEDFKLSTNIPNERDRGCNMQLGFRAYQLKKILFGWNFGIDSISYTDKIIPKLQFPDNISYQIAFSEIVFRSFQAGVTTWTSVSISNDTRNNPQKPTDGYQWIIDTKFAIPTGWVANIDGHFGYIRSGIDGKWYTPLITEYNVVLFLHGYAGMLWEMPGCNIPYKELFHVGGPQSVRGYNFGQIGPTLLGSSLGASKAFFVNSELRFPVNKSGTITAVVFYDGGSGWDTILNSSPQQGDGNFDNIFFYTPPEMLIQNNAFSYRQSVGIGFTMDAPMPLQCYWGFKLDPAPNESKYEIHIQMQGSY